MTHANVLGIDYSMSCPALCLTNGTTHQWWVNYRLSGKPYVELPDVVWNASTTEGDVPRYIELAEWAIAVVAVHHPTLIILEDYAFGAHGRITQLSENAGTLKVKLHEKFPHIPLRLVAPTTMKKFATGRGIATKDDIWAAFIKREPLRESWAKQCHPKASKISSPVADIADSYFLAHYGAAHYGI